MTNLEKNQLLWEAFEERNEKRFVYLLEIGANPDEVLDLDSKLTTFELLCGRDSANYYLKKCIDNGSDPNKMNPYNKQHPIHIAVKNLKIPNIKILVEANAECVNQTFNYDRTPLHLIAELVDDYNVHQVFEIVKVLSDYGADLCRPAHHSEGETPFSLFLENLARLGDRTNAVSIVKYLIRKCRTIEKVEKEKCEDLMREHFDDLMDEYKPADSPVDRNNWIHTRLDACEKPRWLADLITLLKQNEPHFLMRLNIFKEANGTLIRETLIERKFALHTEDLLDLTIEHDRFESFVEIFNMTSEIVDMDYVVQETLYYERHRILKFLVNHPKIICISESWLVTILRKINWKLSADNSCHKCFYILLNHPKFNINGEINCSLDESPMWRELFNAAATNEDAAMALLKRGIPLGKLGKNKHMLIHYLDDDVLKKFLDRCVTTRKPKNMSDNEFSLVIDYSFLESSREMSSIEYIANEPNLQPLIAHPVIASFLFIRWFQLSNVFYLNLLLFSINSISSCLFFILFYVDPELQNSSNNLSLTNHCLKAIAIVSFFIFLGKEVAQFVTSKKAYLTSIENYFEIGLLCLMFLALFTPVGSDRFRRLTTALFIMGTAFEWTLMFSALPMFIVTNYIVMLRRVAINFLRMLAFYSVILVAFALSFYTLLGKSVKTKDSNAPSVEKTIFLTILMMTGDLELKDEDQDEQNLLIFRIFLIVFILSVTIVLMNLLLGLTISDTAAIESQAELHNWFERVKLLSKYESMGLNCCKYLKCFGWAQKLKAMVQLIPDFLPMKKIKIEIFSHVNAKCICIPKSAESDLVKEKGQLSLNENGRHTSEKKLTRSYFGYKTTNVIMDKRIVKSALEILERRGQLESKVEQKTMKKAYQDDVEQKLNQLLFRTQSQS